MAINIDALQTIIEPAVLAVGLELLGLEFVPQGRNSILRVYIDKAEGVDIDDCQTASRQISHALDVDDPIAGHYHLEVSTPGIQRPLFTALHYQQAVGEKIKIKLHVPKNGRRNFVGVLEKLDGDMLFLHADADDTVQAFSLAEVQKGRLVVDIQI